MKTGKNKAQTRDSSDRRGRRRRRGRRFACVIRGLLSPATVGELMITSRVIRIVKQGKRPGVAS